jgi:hypothetical protein
VRNALESGADPNASVDEMATPALLYSVQHGYADMARILLEAGADPSRKDGMFGASPLMAAAVSGDFDTALLLIEAGADVSAYDGYENSALIIAAAHEHRRLAQLLIDHGADPLELSADGWKALNDLGVAFISSSTLRDNIRYDRYSVDKAFDGDPLTSWVEGMSDSGVDETVTVVFERPVDVDSIEIMPGYFDERYWMRNNRVRTLSLTVNTQTTTYHLDDRMEAQMIDFGQTVSLKQLILRILDVYPGTSWDDTCIAEIRFLLRGVYVDPVAAVRSH